LRQTGTSHALLSGCRGAAVFAVLNGDGCRADRWHACRSAASRRARIEDVMAAAWRRRDLPGQYTLTVEHRLNVAAQ
jgi:hypothetical protein